MAQHESLFICSKSYIILQHRWCTREIADSISLQLLSLQKAKCKFSYNSIILRATCFFEKKSSKFPATFIVFQAAV